MPKTPTLITLPRAAIKAITEPRTEKCISPDPAPPNVRSRAAIRRCCAAWQRAYTAYFERKGGDPKDGNMFADRQASEAYCKAMPMLDGYEGVRNFIACAAHGILIGAIPAERSGQLLYAAQVALIFLKQEFNAANPSSARSRTAQPRATDPSPSLRVVPQQPPTDRMESTV